MGIRSKMSGNSATPNAALARLQASVRIGGKGTVRRKKKVVHKTTTTDDKRLQNTLKRLGINSIPAIEEVNLFMDQGEVIHFTNPKVQASIAANTYVIIGHAETKKLQDLFPGILNQVDKSVLPSLKKIADEYQQSGGAEGEDSDDDDAIPDLVPQTFDSPQTRLDRVRGLSKALCRPTRSTHLSYQIKPHYSL